MISNKLPSALLLAAAILPLSVSPAQATPLSQQEQLNQSRAQEAARQERLQFPKQKAELYLGLDVGAVYGADLLQRACAHRRSARRSRNGQRYFLRCFRCRIHRKTRRIPHAGRDLRLLPRVEVLMAILQKVVNQSTDVV